MQVCQCIGAARSAACVYAYPDDREIKGTVPGTLFSAAAASKLLLITIYYF